MDYKGWVLSIYDEYIKRYNKKYNVLEKKVKFKDAIDNMIKKENRPVAIILMIFMISVIIIVVLALLGIIKNIEVYLMSEMLGVSIIAYFYNHKYETDLKTYHRHVDVLREVLEDEGLYNERFIRKLRSYTGGIFYKINEKIRGVIKGGIGIASILGLNYTSTKVDKDFALIILVVIAMILVIAYYVYMYLISMPNSRVIRKKNFHIILNILIAYDFEIKNENNNDNNSIPEETIIVKGIIEHLDKYLLKEKNK